MMLAYQIDFDREFACIAEAVAYLFRRGFKTVDQGNDWRTMCDDDNGRSVFVERVDFLTVKLTDCSN